MSKAKETPVRINTVEGSLGRKRQPDKDGGNNEARIG